MDLFFRPNYSCLGCRNRRYLLAVFWTGGLLSGAFAARCANELLFSTMRAALYGSLSITGLLPPLLLPLLFTAFAVYISRPSILFLLAFLKAFTFSFIAAGVLISFGEAAWLICLLLMFADILILPILWWIWMQAYSDRDIPMLRAGVLAGALSVLIGCVNFALISPYLADLL